MIRDVHPGSGSRIRILIFLPIPDPGSRGQSNGSRVRYTVIDRVKRSRKKDRQMKKVFSIQKLETMHIKKLVLIKFTGEHAQRKAGPITQVFFVISIAFVTVEE
jgi:hypothetical protein